VLPSAAVGEGGLGGLLSGLTGLIPQPFGPVQSGSPGNAPGEFMPLMPSPADAGISPFQVTGPTGLAGPATKSSTPPSTSTTLSGRTI
jgi:hypothetical protein